MDNYSFGMICLWLLLGDAISQQETAKSEEPTFQTPFSDAPFMPLEELKASGALQILATDCIRDLTGVTEEYKSGLRKIFSLTLAREPINRVYDLRQCMDLIRLDE